MDLLDLILIYDTTIFTNALYIVDIFVVSACDYLYFLFFSIVHITALYMCNMFMYMFMYVFMYAIMFMYMFIYMYMFIFMHTIMFMFMFIYMYIFISTKN